MPSESGEPDHLGKFAFHHRLATPVSPWERLKIGGGTPPVLTRHGWLIVYHGVSELAESSNDEHPLCYSAGVMVLSKEHPRVIRYRSAEPVLTPELPQERRGTVANVVFPTGIDRRDDLGSPDRFDVYYGMADNRIGVARLDVPDFLSAARSRRPAGRQGVKNEAHGKEIQPIEPWRGRLGARQCRGCRVRWAFAAHLFAAAREGRGKSSSKCWRSAMRIACAESR